MLPLAQQPFLRPPANVITVPLPVDTQPRGRPRCRAPARCWRWALAQCRCHLSLEAPCISHSARARTRLCGGAKSSPVSSLHHQRATPALLFQVPAALTRVRAYWGEIGYYSGREMFALEARRAVVRSGATRRGRPRCKVPHTDRQPPGRVDGRVRREARRLAQ